VSYFSEAGGCLREIRDIRLTLATVEQSDRKERRKSQVQQHNLDGFSGRPFLNQIFWAIVLKKTYVLVICPSDENSNINACRGQ